MLGEVLGLSCQETCWGTRRDPGSHELAEGPVPDDSVRMENAAKEKVALPPLAAEASQLCPRIWWLVWHSHALAAQSLPEAQAP